MKRVHINEVQNSAVLPHNYAHETVNFNLSCAVAICSLCYCIVKSCSYWNSNTTATIVDNVKRLYDNLCLNGCISSSDLSKVVDVSGAEIRFNVFSDNKEGLLRDSLQSKSIPENAVINNSECTGFLMWLPSEKSICIPSLGASVLPCASRAESKPAAYRCSLGPIKHEKRWWRLCNSLRRDLWEFKNVTYGSQHGNEAEIENPL